MFKAFGKKSVESLMIPLIFSRKVYPKLKELKFSLAYICLSLCLPLLLQGQPVPVDTIRIKEVMINAGKDPSGISVFSKVAVDSSLLKDFTLNSVAELLSENKLMHIQSYGSGGIASPSFRGTGASHTTVVWNGISINNPMPGQSDLSLLPSGLADEINIFNGGTPVLANGGAIGGVIALESDSSWNEGSSISLNAGAANFGRYSGLATLRAGTLKVSSVTKVYYNSSENNFPFVNDALSNEPFPDRRKNSEVQAGGFLQELYLKGTKSLSSARLWYNTTERNIPVPMISRQPMPGENQTDRSLRGIISYKLSLPVSEIKADAAYVADRLLYSNPETSTDSRNLVQTVTLKTEASPKLGEKTQVSFLASHELNIVTSNNYDDRKTRNITVLAMSASRSILKPLAAHMMVRGKQSDGKLVIPDFAAGLKYRLPSQPDLLFKANLSANSKLPGLNDLYWLPGGNPGLKSEYGVSWDLGLDYRSKHELNPALTAGINIFRNRITNMIHWYPGEYSYWSPVNLGLVKIIGAELKAGGEYATDHLFVKMTGAWSYTRASETRDDESGQSTKQLVYVPVHQANARLRAGYGILRASFNSSWTGRRYISADNSDYLPGYLLCDLLAGIAMEKKKMNIDLNFRISNLFNINYQAVAWHPMPGRSYAISLLLKFKNNAL